MFKVECQICRKLITKNNIARHENACNKPKVKIVDVNFVDGRKNKKGIKTGRKGTNQYTKAVELGLPNPIVSEETKLKMIETRRNNGNFYWSDEAKANLSNSMKLAVLKYPESYSSGNRGRVKQITYNGVRFQGGWELSFYQWCENNEIHVERSTDWFEYNYDGIRKYFPDFYLPTYSTYVEVKGYKTDKDEAKWNQFPKPLLIIERKEINQIRKGTYVFPLSSIIH